MEIKFFSRPFGRAGTFGTGPLVLFSDLELDYLELLVLEC